MSDPFGFITNLHPAELAAQWDAAVAGVWWSPVAAVGIIVCGGLLFLPLSPLIAVTAMTFGLGLGTLYSYVGCILSSCIAYEVGQRFGPRLLTRFGGPRLQALAAALRGRGFTAVLLMRFSPVGHFTLESVIAGAVRVRFRDFLLATLLGTLPEVVVVSALGHEMRSLVLGRRSEEALTAAGVLVLLAGALWFLGRRRSRSGLHARGKAPEIHAP